MSKRTVIERDGLVARLVTVDISDTCPVCDGPRGESVPTRVCEDGVWVTVDQWTNPCGHVDTYEKVLAEGQAREVTNA